MILQEYLYYETCMSLPLTKRHEYKLMQARPTGVSRAGFIAIKKQLYTNEKQYNHYP